MGVGLAKQDSKVLKAVTDARDDQARAAAERAARAQVDRRLQPRRACPSAANGPLRAERAYEFLDRLVSIAIPRIRDFRGLSARSFDGRGNYSMGVREQIIFPEIDYDGDLDQCAGWTSRSPPAPPATRRQAFALLRALGMRSSACRGRPKGFDLRLMAPRRRRRAAAHAAKAAEAPVPPARGCDQDAARRGACRGASRGRRGDGRADAAAETLGRDRGGRRRRAAPPAETAQPGGRKRCPRQRASRRA